MDHEEYEDPDDMYDEGVLLLREEGGADLKKAAELLLKASSMGHMPSKRVIGLLYLDGRGVEKDLDKAYELLSEAAASLDPIAMYVLGKMYEGGIGVEQDDGEALFMLAFAAELGFPGAEEDAERVAARIDERRSRKLRSRPVLDLEISDADVEAACCKKMLDSALSGDIRVVETINGPELVKEDENENEVICNECPFCGKKVNRVSKNKIY